jgi:hypothetical protein
MTEIVGKSIPAAADRLKKSPARSPEGIEVIRKKSNSDNFSQNVLSFQLIKIG